MWIAVDCRSKNWVAVLKGLASTDLEHLKLHTLSKGRYQFDAPFVIHNYLVSKFCPSLLKTVSLRGLPYMPGKFLCSLSVLLVKILALLDAL
jgi:hypothetical protein